MKCLIMMKFCQEMVLSYFRREVNMGGQGSWNLYSQSDPRWNCSGRGHIIVMAGMHPDAEAKLDELKEKLGSPPSDLRYSCMKD